MVIVQLLFLIMFFFLVKLKFVIFVKIMKKDFLMDKCLCIILENYSGSLYNDGNDCPIVYTVKDGLSYLANNIYFDIWYSDSTHYRIRYKPDSYLSISQQFASNSFLDSNILMYIYRPSSGRFL